MTEGKRKNFRSRLTQYMKGETTPGVDPDVVRELAALLEANNLTEIEVERGGVRVRVARQTQAAAAASSNPGPAAPMAPTVAAAPTPAAPQPAPAAEAKRGTLVTSPMVGTVYLAPQPGAPPFVNVGDQVSDGTVCIIEAMKTMNPVPSPIAGRVTEIFVRDGQPVEFGEPLMRIE
jgi:acetyl-CoA carboxylase biotin carboxyl carrier protein